MKKFIVIASIFPAMAIAATGISKGPPQETTRTDGQPKAIVKFKPEPHYPEEARKRRIEATIVLRAIFRASREVTDIKFDKVIPTNLPEDIVKALTKEAIKAARKIKFEPAMKDGHPVSMYVQLEYNFRLD